jgi:4-amino-4-deoxy-L-arabinose transferase-like glycosyltransferase
VAHILDASETVKTSGPRQRGLWLAVLAASVLRLWNLGAQSLWIDEIFTWQTASPHGPLTWLDVVSNLNSPLISACAHLWMQAFGQSEFVLRLPMALASIALVPAMAQLARRVIGEEAFLPAAWLTALSPFVIWYGQEFRGYIFAILFTTLALLALLDAQERGRFRDLLLLALWTVLGSLSNMSTALLVPVFAVALFLAPAPGRSRWAGPLVYLALVTLALSPWILHHIVQRLGWLEWGRLVPGRPADPGETALRGDTTFSWAGLPFTFYVLSVGYTLGPSLRDLHAGATLGTLLPFAPGILAAAVTFGMLALIGFSALGDPAARSAALARDGRSHRALRLAVLLVPIGAVTYFALSNFKVYNPRYVAVALPAYFCLLVAGWLALARPARRLAAAAVLVLFAISLLHQAAGARYAKDDFRRATRALDRVVAPQDGLIAVGNFSPLEYYWRDREPVPVVYWAGYARDARMEPRFRALLNPAGPTWVVLSRTHDLDPQGRLETWIRRTWGGPVGVFPGVRIYRIEAPARP